MCHECSSITCCIPPAVWANMFSRHRCGHCLMESSQRRWYHHQVTLPDLDNTRLFPLWSYGKCPEEPCRLLHINTSWHLEGDKQSWHKYIFFFFFKMKPLEQSQLIKDNLCLLSFHQAYLKTNALSSVTCTKDASSHGWNLNSRFISFFYAAFMKEFQNLPILLPRRWYEYWYQSHEGKYGD